MFGRKKRNKTQGLNNSQNQQNQTNKIVVQAIQSLRAAGYSKSQNDYNRLLNYYERNQIYTILSPDLQLSTLLMVWLYWTYGEQEDIAEIESYTPDQINKIQLSLFFYWIPTQYILCRRYGSEIRLRANNPNNVSGPEPNMPQNELEEKYFNARSALDTFLSFHIIPEGMLKMYGNFTQNVERVLNTPPTSQEPIGNRVGMQPANKFRFLNEKGVKPEYNPDVYGYTDYLDGVAKTEDIGREKTNNNPNGRNTRTLHRGGYR